MTRWRAGRVVLGLLVTAAVVALVVVPLVELVQVAAEQLDDRPGGAATRTAAVNSLAVGLSVALLATSLGAGAALLTERTSVAGRRWLRLGVLLPILIPPFVSALSWARAYGPGGLLDDLVGVSLPGLFGPFGVVVVISVNAMPLAYVLTVAALRTRVDRALELAARISGASAPTVARTVTVPLLAPAVVGAAALAFVMGINAFGIPALLGTPASFDTVTTRIYQDLALSARPEAFSRAVLLATGLVATALVFVVAAEWLLAGVGRGSPSAGPAGPSPAPRRAGRLATIAVWAGIASTTLVPLIALILVALTKGVGLAPVPGNWTLANFSEALDGRFVGALGRSLGLAGAAATAGVVLGAAVAALRGRWGRLAGVAVLLGFAVPGSTLAVAVLLGYGRALRDTLLIIFIAYVAKLWAVGHRAVAGSADGVPPDLVLAARSSGAGSWTAARTVLVPLLRPALAGAWVLVFLLAFHELTMSSLLYGPGTDTLAVAILNLQQLGDVPVSSALAVILTVPLLVVAVPLLATGRLPRRGVEAR